MLHNLWKRPLALWYNLRAAQRANHDNLDSALAYVERALATYPSSSHFHLRGVIYLNLGRRDDALADFTEALRLDPKNTSVYVDRGYYFQQISDLGRAISDFNHAIALLPLHRRPYAARGNTRCSCDDFDGAIEDSERGLAHGPKLFAYLVSANAGKGKGEYADALDDCAQVAKLARGKSRMLDRMVTEELYAEVFSAKGDYELALECCEKMKQIAGNDDRWRASYYETYGRVLAEKGETESAIAAFDEALRIAPPQSNTPYYASLYRGDTYYGKGDYAQALIDYTNALNIRPKSSKVLRKRGKTHRLLGDETLANADLVEADQLRQLELEAIHQANDPPQESVPIKVYDPNVSLQLNTTNRRLTRLLIFIVICIAVMVFIAVRRSSNEAQQAADSFRHGDYDDAITHYTNVISGDASNIDAYIGRCRANYENGDDSKAVTDCSRAIELASPASSQSNNAYYYRGLASYDDNKLDAAVADFNVVIGHDSQNADAYYNRGRAYADLGKTISAVQDFKQALKLQPDHPEADYMKEYIAQQSSEA